MAVNDIALLRWKRAALVIILALLCGLGALAAYNTFATARLAAAFPPLGKLYLVDGARMHLYCIGTGSPTILLEAGSGDDVLYWQSIQPELSHTTRVCSYDRAGLGWSEPRTGPHDAEAIAHDLHALLDAAQVSRPLVLVGASAGGFYIREYARQFPQDVAGVAMLDASSPQQLDELPGSRQWFVATRAHRLRVTGWERFKVATGWQRLAGHCREEVPAVLEAWRGNIDAEDCRTEYVDGDLPEWSQFDLAGEQAARLTTFGDVPLVVLSQDPDRPKPGWTADAIAAQPIWSHEQEELKKLSPRSWRVIARGSPHHIHQNRPELVIQQLRILLDYVRGGAAPALGTTTVQ